MRNASLWKKRFSFQNLTNNENVSCINLRNGQTIEKYLPVNTNNFGETQNQQKSTELKRHKADHRSADFQHKHRVELPSPRQNVIANLNPSTPFQFQIPTPWHSITLLVYLRILIRSPIH